ncbi:MAG TPA: DUF1080 domain-containing protein [Gemmataceae bacterium]|jgi:hypothetical protein
MPSRKSILPLICLASALAAAAAVAQSKDEPTEKPKARAKARRAEPREWTSGVEWPEPPVIEPGSATVPPSDAVVLFDGHDLSKWDGGDAWEVTDGYAISRKRSIKTKDKFGDCQLHVEFATPAEVKGAGQGRGNSGVYMMDRYEIQVLDSYQNKTYFDGQCAAIYKQTPPMVNACRKPGKWQTYDILWEAPRFKDDGSVERPAYVTVLQNGVVVQNHTEVLGGTGWDHGPKYEKHPDRAPVQLQFHGNPVRFRNIWVREMKPLVGTPKKPA